VEIDTNHDVASSASTTRVRHEEALVSIAIGRVADSARRKHWHDQCEARHADEHISNDRSVGTEHTISRKAVGAEACEDLILRAVR
jgi:hypothetical protein